MIDDIDLADTALASIAKRWPKAVELAKQTPEGGLHSAWIGPLERLVREREHLLRQAGTDPDVIAVPKKADATEKKLPKQARAAYRRGKHLHGRARTALTERRRKHEKDLALTEHSEHGRG